MRGAKLKFAARSGRASVVAAAAIAGVSVVALVSSAANAEDAVRTRPTSEPTRMRRIAGSPQKARCVMHRSPASRASDVPLGLRKLSVEKRKSYGGDYASVACDIVPLAHD